MSDRCISCGFTPNPDGSCNCTPRLTVVEAGRPDFAEQFAKLRAAIDAELRDSGEQGPGTPTPTNESAWLIEKGEPGGVYWWDGESDNSNRFPTMYHEVGMHSWVESFTRDANKAIRFRTKEDAEAVIRLIVGTFFRQGVYRGGLFTATEHVWCDKPALSSEEAAQPAEETDAIDLVELTMTAIAQHPYMYDDQHKRLAAAVTDLRSRLDTAQRQATSYKLAEQAALAERNEARARLSTAEQELVEERNARQEHQKVKLAWVDFVYEIGEAIRCLPSITPQSNEHMLRRIRDLVGEASRADRRAERIDADAKAELEAATTRLAQLQEKIEALPRYRPETTWADGGERPCMDPSDTGNWLERREVLASLRSHPSTGQ